jgi:O-antigen/teichoic acid export membrane protein
MKNIFALDKWTLALALLSWIIPFFISAFFVDPQSGEYLINEYLFHGGLFVIFTVVIFLCYKKLFSKGILSLKTAHSFVMVNIILDIVILYLLMQVVTLQEWAIMIAPVYFMVCYGMYYLKKK